MPLAQTMCGSSKAVKNSLLGSVTVLHSPLFSAEYCNHQLVFIGGLFVGCADLASVPSGGAWNKSFAGGNALELPTQDIYLAVPWCHNCQ